MSMTAFGRTLMAGMLLIALVAVAGVSLASEEYDVAGIYEKVDAPYGAKALTSLGETVDIQCVLIPKEVEVGSYRIAVTRRGANLYEVVGYGIYLVTRYCYKFGYGVDAIFECTSSGGFSRGRLIFID